MFQDRSSLVSSWSTWYFEALIPWSCSCACNILWAKRLQGWCQTVVLQTHCHTRRKRRISKRSPIIKEVVLQVEWQQVSRLHPTYKYLRNSTNKVVVVEKQALCAREERRDGAFQMIVAEIHIVDIDRWCDTDLPWQGVAVEHQVWQLQQEEHTWDAACELIEAAIQVVQSTQHYQASQPSRECIPGER